jgi:soluble lytic murein transglycosylase-like protein
MLKTDLIALSRVMAAEQGLDPALVAAVIEQESGWNPWAVRYEPGFYRRYVQAMTLSDTEETMRSTSFGLMQCMGQVARELGFKGKYLTELCDPDINLRIGCKHLKNKLDRAHGDLRKALLAWNGGGNPHYPDEVLARTATYGGLLSA